MTNVSELLKNINHNPHLLTNLDWREETDWFSKERIGQIICGTHSDETCDIVGEYIAIAWYEACEGDEYDKTNRERSLMEPSWADTYVFRFNNSESKANLPGSIESYIDEMKAKRSRSIKRKEQHCRLENKVKQLNVEFPQSTSEEAYKEKLHQEMCESLMMTIENRNKEIAELRSELNDLMSKYEKDNRLLDWYRNHEKETKKNASIETCRTLIEQLIMYAENERKSPSRHIYHAIKDIRVNGNPVEMFLTGEWKWRLENIGRKGERRSSSNSSSSLSFNNPVGTVVAHADTVILKSDKHE